MNRLILSLVVLVAFAVSSTGTVAVAQDHGHADHAEGADHDHAAHAEEADTDHAGHDHAEGADHDHATHAEEADAGMQGPRGSTAMTTRITPRVKNLKRETSSFITLLMRMTSTFSVTFIFHCLSFCISKGMG